MFRTQDTKAALLGGSPGHNHQQAAQGLPVEAATCRWGIATWQMIIYCSLSNLMDWILYMVVRVRIEHSRFFSVPSNSSFTIKPLLESYKYCNRYKKHYKRTKKEKRRQNQFIYVFQSSWRRRCTYPLQKQTLQSVWNYKQISESTQTKNTAE
jgi:hypothetical protein